MKEFEKKREQLQKLQVPEDFEARLRNKLNAAPKKKKRIAPWLISAAVLFLGFAVINYPALAFYGKTLFGYEEIMSESIQKLNEEGYGQAINEQITLHDGTILTIEGIMADRNQLEMYYHVTGDGSAFFNEFDFPQITWWTKTYNASHGSFDPTQNKGVQAFESVSPFARNITLHFTYKNQQYEMKFPYDAGKAIPVTLKEKLNETVEFDFGTITFKTITATKGTTRIEGKLKEDTERNLNYNFSNVYLVVDGVELSMDSSGTNGTYIPSTYDFHIDYAGLPSTLSSLAIKVDQFKGQERVDSTIPLNIGKHKLGPIEFDILSIEQNNSKTKIRISSSDDVLFDGVWLMLDERGVPLEGSEGYDEREGVKERTLIFSTVDELKSLYIQNVFYDKDYSQVIDIAIQ